ncbi:MAG: aspartyl protease family protein [Rhodospirillales bacterium]|nr:aspartyl protease family protein [Rhodospirillales bacterium]
MRPVWILLAAWLVGIPVAARAACVPDHPIHVPLQETPVGPVVAVSVNGQPARFLLDTGASRSEVTAAAMRRLHLPRDPWSSTTIRGVGGAQRQPDADLSRLELAGVSLHRHRLDQALVLAVGASPVLTRFGIDGLLGVDILAGFNLTLDLHAGTLSLLPATACDSAIPRWAHGREPVPGIHPQWQWLLVPTRIDHTILLGLIDTGSAGSVITAAGMRRLSGAATAAPGDRRSQLTGQGAGEVTIWLHRYAAWSVGKESVSPAQIWTGPVAISPLVQMIIGRDWLRRHRVWISYATSRIAFTAAATASSGVR